MAYELRRRRNNGVSASYGISDDEGESRENDPDYTRRGSPSRRRARTRNPAETPRQRRKQSAAAAAAAPSQQECSTSGSKPPETEENTVLSLLIKRGEIKNGETVICEVSSPPKEGLIRPEGILCKCCGTTMTVSAFEDHAGSLSVKPFKSIVVIRTNSSLFQHFMKIWNKGEKDKTRQFNRVTPKSGSHDNSDDTCQICADGGDLMCCELCPSTVHLGCVEMEALPEDGWYCCYCKCKYCGTACENKLACVQCSRAFHWKCFGTNEDLNLNSDAMGLFCSSKCKEVPEKIRCMAGTKNTLKDGYTWSLIRRVEADEVADDHERMECNSKVVLAFEVLNESFVTLVDNYTGINILESVVNSTGSNLERVNFSRFYTLIVEKNDAVISAATLRIHGKEVAEMPYIATQSKYRLKGISRMIFNTLYCILSDIGVKNLVIPAIEEVADMWKKKYGFVPIDNEMKNKLINYNTLNFPGTIRLQKNIPRYI